MNVQIYKLKSVGKLARREQIVDASFREAIERAERGIIDADLGAGLIKQRVARHGQGRSGGYRMMIAFRSEHRAIFLLGFAKSERDNISPDQLAALHLVAGGWLNASDAQMAAALYEGFLQEVSDD